MERFEEGLGGLLKYFGFYSNNKKKPLKDFFPQDSFFN